MSKYINNKTRRLEIQQALKNLNLHNENGAALVMALLFLVLLAGMAGLSSSMSTTDYTRTKRHTDSLEAFYIAEAGVEHAHSLLKFLDFDTILSENGLLSSLGTTVSLDGTNYAQAPFNNGLYSVRIDDNDDGDGNMGNDSDGVLMVTSLGQNKDGATDLVTAEVVKMSLGSDKFTAGIHILDEDGELEGIGNSYTVSGINTEPPSGIYDPTCPDKFGVTTQSAASGNGDDLLRLVFNGPAADNVVGVGGGSPDVNYNDFSLTLLEAQVIREALIQNADTIYNGSTIITGGTLGTPDQPKITYFDDSADIKGNTTGAGIIIVNKDFKVNGNFTFEGVVLIGICPTCPGRFEPSSGNSNIYGGIILANPTSEHSDESRIKIQGNADIFYSCQSIDETAGQLFSKTYTIFSWKGS